MKRSTAQQEVAKAKFEPLESRILLDGTTFGPEQDLSLSSPELSDVRAADLDGDGDLDLLCIGKMITWYENLGDASFSTRKVISTEAFSYRLAYTAAYSAKVYAEDLDGDGDLDVLSASYDKIAWHENLGGGYFSDLQVISTAAKYADVDPADLDGDGDIDLLWTSGLGYDSPIAWYENLGGGVFSDKKGIAAQDGATSVHAADVDGDGDVDVLSASFGDFRDTIVWYENLGNEGFTQDAYGHVVANWAGFTDSIHAADLNGDGDLDVLSVSGQGGIIAWYENLGAEGFSDQKVLVTAPWPALSPPADLDGDGDLDLLWFSSFEAGAFAPYSMPDARIAWCENLGDGTFSSEIVISTAVMQAMSAYAADLDDDGDLDVLSGSSLDNKVAWYENLGGGTFSDQKVVSTTACAAASVHAADLDNDGDVDVLSASAYDDKIAWYENLGGGGFAVQKVISTATDGATSVYAADLNGDGRIDVLSTSFVDDKIAWYENLGGGTFSDQKVISTAADEARSVYTADLDDDGDLDVLSASLADDKIAWYENLGGGDFSGQKVISTAADGAWSVHAADLNGDGRIDVLSASLADDKIAWYENLGGGGFSGQKVISTATDGAWSVHAADLNGDGRIDVLSASYRDDKIAWYENLGGGYFSDQKVISTAADGADSVYTADLDGDGDLDVLSASGRDGKIAWYGNLGNGTFSPQKVISTALSWASSVYAADLDSDGSVDVLFASPRDDKIAWYENLTPSPGDANRDGFVDDNDLAIMLDNWEQDPLIISTWARGNFTEGSVGDTDVDDNDLAVLLGNWTGGPPVGVVMATSLQETASVLDAASDTAAAANTATGLRRPMFLGTTKPLADEAISAGQTPLGESMATETPLGALTNLGEPDMLPVDLLAKAVRPRLSAKPPQDSHGTTADNAAVQSRWRVDPRKQRWVGDTAATRRSARRMRRRTAASLKLTQQKANRHRARRMSTPLDSMVDLLNLPELSALGG